MLLVHHLKSSGAENGFDSYGVEASEALNHQVVRFLEDLFVREAFRGRKIGRGLLTAVARIAEGEGCHALRWEVLDWNHAAVKFYESLGAEFLDDWRLVLLKDEELRRLAEMAP